MSALRGITLTVRFICELAMLAALAAPKARHPVATSTRLAIEAVIFGMAAAGLIAAGQPALGIVLAAVAATTTLLNAADG
jgi:hypothetical protein